MLVQETLTMQPTVCECSKPEKIGLLQFSDEQCETTIPKPKTTPVEFQLITTRKDTRQITGYLCSRGNHYVTTSTNLLFESFEIPDRIPIDTSVKECQKMRSKKMCEDEHMDFEDDKWSFTKAPKPEYRWMTKVERYLTNYFLEEIHLVRETSEPVIMTPLGKVNATTGYFMHNHMTLLWDANETPHFPKYEQHMYSGRGMLMEASRNILRLEDESGNSAYHLDRKPICTPGEPDCGNATRYALAEAKEVIIAVTMLNTSEPRMRSLETTSEYAVLRKEAEEQFYFDKIVEHANSIAEITRLLQCELRRVKHSQAVSTAQYNGWLAASQLGFPQCSKLIATGKTVTAILCRKQRVTFETEVTKCGPQPRYGNFTINLDGWELVNFSPCYWSQGFVNFNDVPHAYRNASWEPVKLDVIVSKGDLAEFSKFYNLEFLQYKHLNNPAYSDAVTSHMNIMADIASAMNEHAEWNRSNPVHPSPTIVLQMKPKEVEPLSFWEKIQLAFFATFGLCLFAIFIRILYAVGAFHLVYVVCCRVSRRNPTAPPQEVEMSRLYPAI